MLKGPESLVYNGIEIAVKVHKELLTNIVQTRDKSYVYHTNKLLKFTACYYVLKALSTTGVIKSYHKQINKLCEVLNITEPTFYKLIKGCEQRGYLRREAGNLVLTSYTHFTETFDAIFTQFVTIYYTPGLHRFTHCMEAAYLQVKEQERAKTFESRFKAIPEVLEELKTVINPDQHGNYQKSLAAAQIAAFKKDAPIREALFYFNPDTSVNAKTMQAMFNFKSQQSVAYLKEKLQRAKLVTVQERKIYATKYRQKIKHLYTPYDHKKNATFWYMPDRLQYAPFLKT